MADSLQTFKPEAISAERSLLSKMVAELIRKELSGNATVMSTDEFVILSIPEFELKYRLGILLQQIYRVVDQHIPVRSVHLSLIIKDTKGTYENAFRIWQSSQ